MQADKPKIVYKIKSLARPKIQKQEISSMMKHQK